MSYWLGQQLSEGGGPGATDPLKDRVWLALQFLLTFFSMWIAVAKLGDRGNHSLVVGGGLLVAGLSVLYLLFVRGPLQRVAIAGAVIGTLVLASEYLGLWP
jgi:hypothetical protein